MRADRRKRLHYRLEEQFPYVLGLGMRLLTYNRVRQMKDGWTGFMEFKRLVAGLRDWGYDVRDDGEFGEFALGGFVCSYRYFGVLDVNFLMPGELLADALDPDLVLTWNGTTWEELSELAVSPQTLSNQELYRTCVRTINFRAGNSVGIGATYCVVPSLV